MAVIDPKTLTDEEVATEISTEKSTTITTTVPNILNTKFNLYFNGSDNEWYCHVYSDTINTNIKVSDAIDTETFNGELVLGRLWLKAVG